MGVVYAKENARTALGNEARDSEDAQYRVNKEPQDGVKKKEVNLQGVKARVDKVHVDGLQRTKDDIVVDAVKDLFKAKDFKEVLLSTHRVKTRLESLGCFRNIGIFIDTSSGPEASPDGLEVTFFVRELKHIAGGINTMVGNNNEGSLVFNLRLPNLQGRGEKLQAEYSYGSKRTSTFNVSYTKPFRGRLSSYFSTSAFQSCGEWPSSGYRETDRGVLLDFGFNSAPTVKHNIQWEGVFRDIGILNRLVPFAIREHAGPSLKSAVRHILSVDSRDEPIFPTGGSLFQLTSEFAGIGGNVGFIRNEFLFQNNISIFDEVVLQGALNAGFLKNINDDKMINMCDQFYLGGPLSLRGFQMRGVGPHVEGCASGADVFWASALHLYAPLPFRPGEGGFGDLFRTHLFLNAGNIGNFNFSDDYQQNMKTLWENFRLSYGMGIAFRLGHMARIELNYCIPALFQRGDRPNSGVQFGIGVQFL